MFVCRPPAVWLIDMCMVTIYMPKNKHADQQHIIHNVSQVEETTSQERKELS